MDREKELIKIKIFKTMFKYSLDEKPIFTREDGIKVKDLTASMFNLQSKNFISYNIYRVPKEFAMRPDLISAAAYNNTLYAEIILKFNGISNPFSIQEGDIILIPNLESAQAVISQQKGTDSDGSKKIRDSYKYIDPVKIPKASNDYKDLQIVSGAKEGSLPPNIANENETQITYRNGRVYFSSDVDTCLENGMTQSEFLTNIIKTKST